jgi:transposase
MDRAELKGYLDEGMSFEAIGRLVGLHASTVGYWARRHQLSSRFAARHAARGPFERERLEALVREGLTIRAMAERLDRSPTTVRYWLDEWDLRVRRARRDRVAAGRAARTAGHEHAVLRCPIHGPTVFRLNDNGRNRCVACRMEAVAKRRRAIKEVLVTEAGGRCASCGYSACLEALHFHHRDPTSKSFGIANAGVSRSLSAARSEAAKCTLLCGNCHAEVEAGLRALPFHSGARRSSRVAQSGVAQSAERTAVNR